MITSAQYNVFEDEIGSLKLRMTKVGINGVPTYEIWWCDWSNASAYRSLRVEHDWEVAKAAYQQIRRSMALQLAEYVLEKRYD